MSLATHVADADLDTGFRRHDGKGSVCLATTPYGEQPPILELATFPVVMALLDRAIQ